MSRLFDKLTSIFNTTLYDKDNDIKDELSGVSPKEARKLFDKYGNPVENSGEEGEDVSPKVKAIRERARQRRKRWE